MWVSLAEVLRAGKGGTLEGPLGGYAMLNTGAMGFFLGIDGGGSKTECLLADEAGAVLARAHGAGANLRRVSPAELQATVGDCAEQLRRAVALAAIAPEVVCAGFAGAAHPEARAMARSILTGLLHPRSLYVVGDMEVALEAAVGAAPGVVLIGGTGSIAYGRNHRGQQARAGGRGPLGPPGSREAGDEGSSFDIGRCAVEAVRRAHDGCAPRTCLAEIVLDTLQVSGVEQLDPRRLQVAKLAALVPCVVQAARGGDQPARDILEQAARALAGLAVTVLHQLGLLAAEVRVATSGGVFAQSKEVFAGVRGAVEAAAPRALVEPLPVTPVEGAVRLGQRLWLQERAAAPA